MMAGTAIPAIFILVVDLEDVSGLLLPMHTDSAPGTALLRGTAGDHRLFQIIILDLLMQCITVDPEFCRSAGLYAITGL